MELSNLRTVFVQFAEFFEVANLTTTSIKSHSITQPLILCNSLVWTFSESKGLLFCIAQVSYCYEAA